MRFSPDLAFTPAFIAVLGCRLRIAVKRVLPQPHVGRKSNSSTVFFGLVGHFCTFSTRVVVHLYRISTRAPVMHTGARWPKGDRIRWVEERLRERGAKEIGHLSHRDLDTEGVPDRTSLEVWLAKERDGSSWQEIVIQY